MESIGVRLVLSIYNESYKGDSVSTLLCHVPGNLCDDRTDDMLENITRERYINVEPLSKCLNTAFEPKIVNKHILLFNLLISPKMDSLDMGDNRDRAHIAADFLDIPYNDALYYTGLWNDYVKVFAAVCSSSNTWMTMVPKEGAKINMERVDEFNQHHEAPVFAFVLNYSLKRNPVDPSKIEQGTSYEGIRLPVVYSKEESRRRFKDVNKLRFEKMYLANKVYKQRKKEIDSLFSTDCSVCVFAGE
jgi:hypothetical protein